MGYPTNPDERDRLRDLRVTAGRRRGEQMAIELYSTLACQTGRHASNLDVVGYCKAHSSNCLCECHDDRP